MRDPRERLSDMPGRAGMKPGRCMAEQRTEAAKLDAAIAANLKELGYGG